MNYDGVCRVCLQKLPENGQKLVSSSDFLEKYENLRISDAFTKVTGYEILEHEPQLMCSRCVELVSYSYELRQTAEMTQGRLYESLTLKQEVNDEIKLEIYDNETRFDDKINDLDSDESLIKEETSVAEPQKHEKPFKCDFCNRSYLTQPNLNKHLDTKHYEKYEFKCDWCHKRFLTPLKLKCHTKICPNRVKTSNDDKKIRKKCVCPVCGILALREHIINHVKSLEKDPTTPKYICDICGASYLTRASIGNHIRFQHLGIILKCKQCPAEFNAPSLLSRHMRKFHVKHVFKCRVCDFRCMKEVEMKKHRRVHSDNKSFKCHLCKLEFVYNCQLQQHLATHSDARPHKCELCGATFKMRKTLQVHKKMHEGKDYECPVCFHEFMSNQLLRRHVEKNHPEYELPPPGTVLSKSGRRRLEEQKMIMMR